MIAFKKNISIALLILISLRNLRSEECGNNFDARTATFSSPSYATPDIPTNNESCDWRITGSSDEKIVLTVTDLDIEKSEDCNLNYVEVRDGHWHDSPLLGKFCGEGALDPIKSTENKMLVSYVYNDRKDRRGFLANYEALCGDSLFVEEAVNLTSPNYPGIYPNNKKCIWKIEVHETKKAAISFQTFNLENANDCSCDFVRISNGWTAESSLIGVYCNVSQPFEILSDTNKLLVEFVSDSTTQKTGFSAVVEEEYDECLAANDCEQICINTMGSYKCDCNPGFQLAANGKDCEVICGVTLSGKSGTIQPPNFPDVYPLNGTCSWDIVTLHDTRIKMQFTHLDIDDSHVQQLKTPKCDKDKVDIYHRVNGTFELLGEYCGTTIPEPILSEKNEARIVFSSYYSTKITPFALDFISVFEGCSVNNGNCQYECVNATGTTKCVCLPGYSLSQNGLDCIDSKYYHYEISALSGKIRSPNYPNDYPQNKIMWWQFMTTPGHRIEITFQTFEISSKDTVILHDGPSSSTKILASFTAAERPLDSITSTSSNQLYIEFQSDYRSQQGPGFLANYSSACGGKLTASSEEKYIYSHPDFGYSDYKSNTDCAWNITSSYALINLEFELLNIENSVNCTYDYIEIFNDDDTFGRFCGDQLPPNIISHTKSLQIQFHSDDGISSDGFALKYKYIKPS